MTDLPLEHVHVEPDAPTDGPAPAAVVLHGRGADETDLLPVARALPDALHVISLRAPNPEGDGYSWYVRTEGEFRRGLDAVVASIDAATEAFDLAPDRVGLVGFSQGAIVSLALLCERPARFAWVAALHGVLHESRVECDRAGIAGKPVFVGTGDGDAIIRTRSTEATADRLRELGADVELGVYDAGHEIGAAERDAVAAFVARRLDADGDGGGGAAADRGR